MSLSSWLPWTFSRSQARRGQRHNPVSRPKKARLVLEPLEDRALLSSYAAASVSALIADINLSNTAGGSNTISLTAPTTSPYILTAVNNTTDGATGLPMIAANDNLTILGNGDTIERSAGASNFRLLDVASGASLTLQNLTLQGGYTSWGSGLGNPYGGGGAISNQGALTLSGVTVTNNQVGAGWKASVGGGAIWSNGSLILENGTLLTNNTATGPPGLGSGSCCSGYPPGNAYGGAVYIAGGIANISNTTFTNNRANVGLGTPAIYGGKAFGGALYVAAGQVVLTTTTMNSNSVNLQNPYAAASYGGGLYVAGGTVTLTSDTVESNRAHSAGGGIYIASGATVYIDAFTLANVINNINGNIVGTYIKT